jgi:hypothetical protein
MFYRLPSEMYLLWDIQLQRCVNHQSVAVQGMSSWFRTVEWYLCRKLPVWILCFPKRQLDVYRYVLSSHSLCLC